MAETKSSASTAAETDVKSDKDSAKAAATAKEGTGKEEPGRTVKLKDSINKVLDELTDSQLDSVLQYAKTQVGR